MIISIKEKFASQIEEIWHNKRFENLEILKRGFSVQDNIMQNALFFVGVNPSYKSDSKGITKVPFENYYVNTEDNLHPYFKKFSKISQDVKIPWTHLDLLFVRETSQNNIKSLEKGKDGKDLIDKQLKISKEIIELANPKIIVVNNTYAKYLLESDKFSTPKFEYIFDKELGTYIIISPNSLKGTPIFFTGMLTGQRALDLGSLERLTWHIEYVNKLIEK